MRRLSIFVGTFQLDGGLAVAAAPGLDAGEVAAVIAGLVQKSLVTAHTGEGRTLYRLLATTRFASVPDTHCIAPIWPIRVFLSGGNLDSTDVISTGLPPKLK